MNAISLAAACSILESALGNVQMWTLQRYIDFKRNGFAILIEQRNHVDFRTKYKKVSRQNVYLLELLLDKIMTSKEKCLPFYMDKKYFNSYWDVQ